NHVFAASLARAASYLPQPIESRVNLLIGRRGSRECHRLRTSLNHVRRLALRHILPQRSERLLQLLVGHRLEDIAVHNLEFLGNQQSTDFHVRRRLRLAHLLDGLWSWRLKSAESASRKSLLNDLRVASNDPPGFPDHPGANLPLMRLGT